MTYRFVTIGLTAAMLSPLSHANESTLDGFDVLLSDAPTGQTIQNVLQGNPDQVLDVLSYLLENELIDPQIAITEAMTFAPEQAQAIAQLARDAGVSNEVITTSALLAEVDPTAIAEATAAGLPATAVISPPATPAVGSGGGGGLNVVSPN